MINTTKSTPIYVNNELINLYKQAGIDPATGLPIRAGTSLCDLKQGLVDILAVKDLQTAVNRYVWYNLPNGLTGQELERMLYYKSQLIGFYSRSDGNFYVLPYALSGTIDLYGKYKKVTPVQIGSAEDEAKGKLKPIIQGLELKPIYDFNQIDDETFENGAVILRDYTPLGVSSQRATPRAILQRPLIDAESEALPFARTNLIANSGVKGMRVADESAQAEVKLQSRAVTKAALEGNPWIPIVGMQEFQDLTSNGRMATNEYTAYMQTLDNMRLGAYGLSTNGVQTKSAHMLETEQDRNANNDAFIYQDGLKLRQHFCDLVNAIWGLGIWCEPAETITGNDEDMDGNLMDEQDQSGQENGEQPESVGGEV